MDIAGNIPCQYYSSFVGRCRCTSECLHIHNCNIYALRVLVVRILIYRRIARSVWRSDHVVHSSLPRELPVVIINLTTPVDSAMHNATTFIQH